MLCVALPLAAADRLVKTTIPTPQWAYHERSFGWLALSLGLFAGLRSEEHTSELQSQ